jgi:hypothetical protein
MQTPFRIEEIDAMRRQLGIDDIELREEISRLKIGDFVNLTLLTNAGPFGGETLAVRITSIRDSVFRGKLAVRPTLAGLSKVQAGSPVRFTVAQIHSVAKGQLAHE